MDRAIWVRYLQRCIDERATSEIRLFGQALCNLKKGLYFAPSPFESNFLSLAHSDEELKGLAPLLEEIFRRVV